MCQLARREFGAGKISCDVLGGMLFETHIYRFVRAELGATALMGLANEVLF